MNSMPGDRHPHMPGMRLVSIDLSCSQAGIPESEMVYRGDPTEELIVWEIHSAPGATVTSHCQWWKLILAGALVWFFSGLVYVWPLLVGG